MTTPGIEGLELHKLRVLVLTGDSNYAQLINFRMASFGISCMAYAESLSAVTPLLRKEAVDIIVAEIHADRADGLMLPGVVSELNLAGRLQRIPHIIWTAEHRDRVEGALVAGLDQGWRETLNGVSMTALLSHARLARAAGIHVDIARESTAETLLAVMQRLASIVPDSPCVPIPTAITQPSEEDVIAALASGDGLRVVFQPQYHLQTKDIVGAEALIRWQHPLYGDVPPSVFIPLVNQLGLDLLLFSYIEKRVIETLTLLDGAGGDIPIAVNASARTLCTPGLATRLASKMQKAGLPARRLKIELTEDVMPDNALALSASITALRAKGFPVSLDDFGAGAATLALLSQMPFDEMKIDGALVRAVVQDPTSRQVISGVVALAKLFNLRLVTEGIEDESTVSLLNQLGCEVGQGYALARPMELDAFMQIAASRPSSA